MQSTACDEKIFSSRLISIIHRAFSICDQDSIKNELRELSDALQQNGYTTAQINKIIEKHRIKEMTNILTK